MINESPSLVEVTEVRAIEVEAWPGASDLHIIGEVRNLSGDMITEKREDAESALEAVLRDEDGVRLSHTWVDVQRASFGTLEAHEASPFIATFYAGLFRPTEVSSCDLYLEYEVGVPESTYLWLGTPYDGLEVVSHELVEEEGTVWVEIIVRNSGNKTASGGYVLRDVSRVYVTAYSADGGIVALGSRGADADIPPGESVLFRAWLEGDAARMDSYEIQLEGYTEE